MNQTVDPYRPEIYSDLANAEAGHWWFRARNRIILHVLSRYAGTFGNFLEIGCGTGFVLAGIHKTWPDLELFGSEYFQEGLTHARSRVPSAHLCQLDAKVLDEEMRYDAIGAFDVIEHIDDDDRVLANLARALRPGKCLLLTVPQHRWLWSAMDEHACHVRRYSRRELVRKVRQAGLEVEYVTSFVSLLLPVMFLARLRGKRTKSDPMAEFRIPAWLNRMLEGVMYVELGLLKIGARLPAGGSLLVLARRPSEGGGKTHQ